MDSITLQCCMKVNYIGGVFSAECCGITTTHNTCTVFTTLVTAHPHGHGARGAMHGAYTVQTTEKTECARIRVVPRVEHEQQN
jgi:hypothetical protein